MQGVGFRPFVFQLARKLDLGGQVRNDQDGVFIEVQGPAHKVALFQEKLEQELPPLARISALAVEDLAPCIEGAFQIIPYRHDQEGGTDVIPDAATCAGCHRNPDHFDFATWWPKIAHGPAGAGEEH